VRNQSPHRQRRQCLSHTSMRCASSSIRAASPGVHATLAATRPRGRTPRWRRATGLDVKAGREWNIADRAACDRHNLAEKELVVVPVPPSSRPAGIISPSGNGRSGRMPSPPVFIDSIAALTAPQRVRNDPASCPGYATPSGRLHCGKPQQCAKLRTGDGILRRTARSPTG